MNDTDEVKGKCEDCENRFIRIFKRGEMPPIFDENGTPIQDLEDMYNNFIRPGTTVVIDMCLITEIPMNNDDTSSCSHYKPKEDEDSSLF